MSQNPGPVPEFPDLYGATAASTAGSSPEELERLRRHASDLRGRLRSHVRISTAQGVLMERYRFDDPDLAFALMRQAPQHANIKMHQLADALMRVPGPERGADAWFPRRSRTAPPPLKGLGVGDESRADQGAVLGAVLRQVMEVAGTDMGNVQLVDAGGLRLTKHTGLSRDFVDFFAFVEQPTTSCAQAAEHQRQVTVRDVATATVFDEDSRRAVLEADSRSCRSVPLIDHQQVLRGMVSSHHARPTTGFGQAELRLMQATGRTAGRWLACTGTRWFSTPSKRCTASRARRPPDPADGPVPSPHGGPSPGRGAGTRRRPRVDHRPAAVTPEG